MITLLKITDSGDALSRWFYTNAPAAWISAVIAVVSLLFVLRSRKKPRRLVIREIRNTSLVDIWPSVRQHIQMTFSGRPITTLAQVDLQLFNEGSEVINQPTFSISLPQNTRILGVLLTPPLGDPAYHENVSANTATITLPYLNPVSDHQQVFTLFILADGDTNGIRASGGGAGWSVRHLQLPTEKQLKIRRRVYLALMAALVLLVIPYDQYLQAKFQIRASEMSLRSLIAHLPVLLIMLLLAFLLGRSDTRTGRISRRIRK